MSHAVNIKSEFQELDVLLKAFGELGWKIDYNTTIRTYARDPRGQETFDLVVRNPDLQGYDIAIVEGDETHELVLDFYGGSIESQLGDRHGNLAKLKKKYSEELLRDEYSEYELDIEEMENGALEVTVME